MTERTLKRDRAVVLAGVAAISAVAWAYTIRVAIDMPRTEAEVGGELANTMIGMAMPRVEAWGAPELLLTFAMWAVMMIAMMTPSAAPMLLTFDGLTRRGTRVVARHSKTAVFLAGYLLLWGSFAAGATLLQWGLQAAGHVSAHPVRASPVLGGALLLLAGVYQFTPLKEACLSRCRSPLSFLMTEWREGERGALVMGLRHGAYCIGCCWALMLLLFVAGVMNLMWVAAIAAYVLAEKALAIGRASSRPVGIVLLAAGGWLLVRGFTG